MDGAQCSIPTMRTPEVTEEDVVGPPGMTKELQGLLSHGYHNRMFRNSVQVITPDLMKGSDGRLPGDFGTMVPIHLDIAHSDGSDALQPLQGHIDVVRFMPPLRRMTYIPQRASSRESMAP